MSRSIVVVRGSPSTTSRSTVVAEAVTSDARRAGVSSVIWSLTDFDPADVFFGRAGASAVARFIESVRGAAAVVFATPVYKATYSGALKALVDLIPADALVDRPALGIATARRHEHSADVNRAYRALFAFFGARPLETLFLLDSEVTVAEGVGHLAEGAAQRAQEAARLLVAAAEATALA